MEMWSYNRLILKTGQSSLQVDVYSKIVLSYIQGMVFYKVLIGSLRGLVSIFCQDQNGWLVSPTRFIHGQKLKALTTPVAI